VAEHLTPTRVVYVDNDPVVHVHANALLSGHGNTAIALAGLGTAVRATSKLA
jgi:hypothetical protein